MKTESYKWWEEVQSKLHQNFNNVRLNATHILWLSENFPPTKCEQTDVIKSLPSLLDIEKEAENEKRIRKYTVKDGTHECGYEEAGFVDGAKWMIEKIKKLCNVL